MRPRSRHWTLRLRPRLGAQIKRVQTENGSKQGVLTTVAEVKPDYAHKNLND